jgi:hypothetical protein
MMTDDTLVKHCDIEKSIAWWNDYYDRQVECAHEALRQCLLDRERWQQKRAQLESEDDCG